jgi:hypothetical protein
MVGSTPRLLAEQIGLTPEVGEPSSCLNHAWVGLGSAIESLVHEMSYHAVRHEGWRHHVGPKWPCVIRERGRFLL